MLSAFFWHEVELEELDLHDVWFQTAQKSHNKSGFVATNISRKSNLETGRRQLAKLVLLDSARIFCVGLCNPLTTDILKDNIRQVIANYCQKYKSNT